MIFLKIGLLIEFMQIFSVEIKDTFNFLQMIIGYSVQL